ncbi:MAG: hypothetical protein IKO01_01815 [Kiritimatiellae bacterium]|nr:hypothetical protein [Kiritimatiellia bacterium]
MVAILHRKDGEGLTCVRLMKTGEDCCKDENPHLLMKMKNRWVYLLAIHGRIR